MVIVGLFMVVVVSIVVAYVGLRYSEGASSTARAATISRGSTIDLTDAGDGTPAPSTDEWAARGFRLEAAAPWIDHGFDPDHAFLFHSLGLDAPTAARLRRAGLDDADLLTLVEEASFAHHEGHEQLVMLAEKAPHLAPQALAWMRLGASASQALEFATEGFTPAAADTWRAAGWHLDDALPWFAARFEPTPARAWRDAGFEPDEAGRWRREHFGLRQAIEWRGVSPDDTRRWLQAGVRDPNKADALRRRGYGPDDMSYGSALTRDHLLAAADQIAAVGGSPDVERRLREIAGRAGRAGDLEMGLIEDALDEMPSEARALSRRLERALLLAARSPVN